MCPLQVPVHVDSKEVFGYSRFSHDYRRDFLTGNSSRLFAT